MGGGKECSRSEEHTSELQSLRQLVCRLLLEKKDCWQPLVTMRWTSGAARVSPLGGGGREEGDCLGGLVCVAGDVEKVAAERFFFFFNDTAPTEIYTLSLHDALPI